MITTEPEVRKVQKTRKRPTVSAKSTAAPIEVTDSRNSEEFKALSASFHDEFTPATMHERFLVDTLVHSEWRQRQCARLEAAIWRAHRIPEGSDRENSTTAIFFRALKDLDRVGRAEETYSKMFHSALKRLLAIRRERAKAVAARPPVVTAKKPSSGLFCVPKQG